MTIVAHITEMRQLGPNLGQAGGWPKGRHMLCGPSATGASAIPVPAVIYHGKTMHRLFSIPERGAPLELNDIIRTSPTTVLGISFVIGGAVGVNASSVVRVTGERSVEPEELTVSNILLRQLHIWNQVNHEKSTHLLIQTNGGVMGIKG